MTKAEIAAKVRASYAADVDFPGVLGFQARLFRVYQDTPRESRPLTPGACHRAHWQGCSWAYRPHGV